MSREFAFVCQPIEECQIDESELALPPEQSMGESREMIRESIKLLLAYRGKSAKNACRNSLWESLMIESSAA